MTAGPEMWCQRCGLVSLTDNRVCANCGTPNGRKPPRPHTRQIPLPAEILKPYRVVLTDPGPKMLSTTKIIYEISKLDLKRALNLAKHPPSIVATFDTWQDAVWLQRAFQDVGALARVQELVRFVSPAPP